MTETQRNEALVERGRIINEMRALNDKAIAEKRDLNQEELENYGKMDADQKAIKARVDRDIEIEAAAKQNNENNKPIPGMPIDGTGSSDPRASAEYKSNFKIWMRHGDAATPLSVKQTLVKGDDAKGGYFIPIEYETAIVKKMYNANVMRQIATVTRTSSTRNIPMEGTLPTFGWIDELGVYPQTDLTVGQSSMASWKLGGIIKISEELLEDAFIDMADYISDRSSVAAGLSEEAAFIAGDGNKKPTGILSSIEYGLTAAATNSFTGDELFNLVHTLGRPYRTNAKWLLSDAAILSARKLKDTTGQYLWNPGLQAGVPDTLLAKPVYTSDFLGAVAASAVPVLYGDFSYYQIVDRIGWTMMRLNELYAETGQIGFRMNERTDGKLLLPEAVVALTMKAA